MRFVEFLRENGFQDYKPTAKELKDEIASYKQALDTAKGPNKATLQTRIKQTQKKLDKLKEQ